MGIEAMAVIALVLGVALLIVLWATRGFNTGLDSAYYKSRWSHVASLMQSGHGSDLRLAVIDGDKLLDKALKDARFSGSTMADRLRAAESVLGSSYETIWAAHKLRNRIVHDDVHLKKSDVKSALRAFEAGLKSLGAFR
jgi:hypothetical protein